MAAEESWFVAERAEALAVLYLTRHEGLEVIPVSGYARSPGYDLLVRVTNVDVSDEITFAVETKGMRRSPRPRNHTFRVIYAANQLKRGDLPVCVFLFNVDTEQGFYRWLYEPVVTPSGQADLRFNLETEPEQHLNNRNAGIVLETPFEKLDDEAIDAIVHRVVRWYEARVRSRSS